MLPPWAQAGKGVDTLFPLALQLPPHTHGHPPPVPPSPPAAAAPPSCSLLLVVAPSRPAQCGSEGDRMEGSSLPQPAAPDTRKSHLAARATAMHQPAAPHACEPTCAHTHTHLHTRARTPTTNTALTQQTHLRGCWLLRGWRPQRPQPHGHSWTAPCPHHCLVPVLTCSASLRRARWARETPRCPPPPPPPPPGSVMCAGGWVGVRVCMYMCVGV